MWKRHKKEFAIYILAIIGIVFGMLFVVTIFEYYGIHVPGSREMWMGFIGAVIGGAFTMLGVLVSIYNQETILNEEKRLQNMPIIGFEIIENPNSDVENIITYCDGELITSGFSIFETKIFVEIKVSIINNVCAFNWVIEGCAINGKQICCGSAFNPRSVRIASGETVTFAFDYADNINTNIFCLLRFSFEDIFGNKYYQDLPFIYYEAETLGKRKKQIINIRDIKQPVFISAKEETIEESAKKYMDYEAFKS